jgi:UDP-N-acetylmuramoyl-tripeptide--D-alanyl-D-alanine ligase
MEYRSLTYVAQSVAGELLNGPPDKLVSRVCTDSRQAQEGDLFIALSGEKFDGHDFVAEVAGKGVVAVVVEKRRMPVAAGKSAVVVVENTRQALGRLGARYRADFDLPVIAVGGSNGKTSTKELIASVLRQKLKTLWSESSFNNDIGVPMTLLKLEKQHGAVVSEVGTNHPGELAPLVRMVQPRYGVITSIGREHLEFFGDLEGVAREEGWLAELLPPDGTLFLSGDGEWRETLAKRTNARVVTAGFAPDNDWRATELKPDLEGTRFEVITPNREFSGSYRIKLHGRHQVGNALYAVAVGCELGLSPEQVRTGLAECKPAKMRLETWSVNGVCVLDDSYNANADSVAAALETLREMPCSGRRVAVLGDMAELGPHAPAAHEEVGRRAAESGVNHLFVVGRMAGLTAGSARSAGLAAVEEFAEVPVAAEALKAFLRPGDVVLLKASRSSRLERIADALRAGGDQK